MLEPIVAMLQPQDDSEFSELVGVDSGGIAARLTPLLVWVHSRVIGWVSDGHMRILKLTAGYRATCISRVFGYIYELLLSTTF